MTERPISRRTAIAAAVAITCMPGIAEAPDPIFAVLQSFERAQEALAKAIKAAVLPPEQMLTPAFVETQSRLKDTYAIFKKARLDLLTTTPMTRAGMASLLIRLRQPTYTNQPDGEPSLLVEALCWHDEPTREAACTVLNRVNAIVLKIV